MDQTNAYLVIFIDIIHQTFSHFLKNLISYFSHREIEGNQLIENAYIRLEIADCLQILEFIQTFNLTLLPFEGKALAHHMHRLVALGRKCIKLVGGVSQLQGSVVELYATTILIMNTYCEEIK
jgi:hypothetical protein